MASSGGMGMIVRLTGAAVALALGISASLWLMEPANLPIRQVSLHGEFHHLDPIELQEVVAEELTGNMLTQDLGGLEQRLQQNAWVRQARIHRDWPATLRIEISEQVPVARWAAGGFLTGQGERFGQRGGAGTVPAGDCRDAGARSRPSSVRRPDSVAAGAARDAPDSAGGDQVPFVARDADARDCASRWGGPDRSNDWRAGCATTRLMPGLRLRPRRKPLSTCATRTGFRPGL